MIMFNIAEWIANVLILGLGVCFWMFALGLAFLIITELVNKVTGEST